MDATDSTRNCPSGIATGPLLRCTGVGKRYEDGRQEIWAVREVELTLTAGELGLLVGPSGSGKSTLLALISGLARPTEGEIVLAGCSLARLPERWRTEHRRRRVGLVFQQFHLLERDSVLTNVLLPLLPWGIARPEAERRARQVLTDLGLARLIGSPVGQLSGGELQRVALARALVTDPPLLLLDEPTSQLDLHNAQQLLDELDRLHHQGRTLLISTHDPRVIERLGRHRLFRMEAGRLASPEPVRP